jgi:hypothetical protein
MPAELASIPTNAVPTPWTGFARALAPESAGGAAPPAFVVPEAASTTPSAAPLSVTYRPHIPLAEADLYADLPANPAPAAAPAPTGTPAAAPATATPAQANGVPSSASTPTYYKMGDAGNDPTTAITAPPQTPQDGKSNEEATGLEKFLWGKDGFSFTSLLHALNPLQYIPVVSSIYQRLTGDSVGAVARTIGGTLLGGPIGAISAIVNSMFEAATGKDIGGHLMAALFGDDKPSQGDSPAASTAIAQASQDAMPQGAVAVAGLPWLKSAPATGDAGALANADSSASPQSVAQAALPQGATAVSGLPWLNAASGNGAAQTGSLANATAVPAAAQMPFPWGGKAPAMPSNTQLATAPTIVEPNVRFPINQGKVPADFATRMMEGLDKYRAAAKLRAMQPASVDVGG